MAETYPTTLPIPILSGYSYSGTASNVDTTEKSFGFQTQKAIANQESEIINIILKLTDAELDIFKQWFQNDLINGHKWFFISLKDGNGYIQRTARITPDKYTASMISNCVWQVTFKLNTQEKTYISSSEYLALAT